MLVQIFSVFQLLFFISNRKDVGSDPENSKSTILWNILIPLPYQGSARGTLRSFALRLAFVTLFKIATIRAKWAVRSFALRLAFVTLFKRATIRAKWAVRSFHFFQHKSDLLFMKESFALFTSGLCSFWIVTENCT